MQRPPTAADRQCLLPTPARRSSSWSPARTRPRTSYGSMQQRSDAGPSTSSSPVVVYPALATPRGQQGPFSTERPPSPPPTTSSSARSLRLRNGKSRADDAPVPPPPPPPPPVDADLDPAPASTGARPQPEASAPRTRKKWGGLVFELENRGSVARDHLAGERTFLAWLRTSLGLASIGIAITQLFRLPSTTTTTTTSSSLPPSSTASASASASSLSSALAALASSHPALAPLVPVLEAQQAEIALAQARISDSSKYRHLGKPIGSTFIALALVFLLLGIHRFFVVQQALMREPSQFPPSRRSVGFGSFCVAGTDAGHAPWRDEAALILASFVAILTTK
ncbi:hypothetical protein DMC30DRAFT_415102 [Rhodotorula diobovata]|uniref:DUF202 domain-containing protein n=1 Tax=Rhodotorula diobovata TaxID=5288 RepID=A0A5C5G1I7_9BASI|nr:hypothetical protein DMC30DRAFT_415102 [Rhodotorula diobovata]